MGQDDGVFKSKQDITCTTTKGCNKKDIIWPLIPRDRYVAPVLPSPFRKIGLPSPRAASNTRFTRDLSLVGLPYPGQVETENARFTDGDAAYAMPANTSPSYDASLHESTMFPSMRNPQQDATLLDPSGHS